MNSQSNQIQTGDLPVHQWYRFVLSFPPHLVRSYIDQFHLGPDDVVLDPFCGTGTTLVECKKHGIKSVGIEALPMTYFASKTKVDWSGQGSCLREHAEGIAALSKAYKPQTVKNDQWIHDCYRLLLKNSLSEQPFRKSIALLNGISGYFNEQESVYKNYARLAFASTVVHDASNLHFGPEVGVRRIKQDAPVLENWLERVEQFSNDLESVQQNRKSSSRVLNLDSRTTLNDQIKPKSISAVITSPPYPNEKDYSRITRLESVLLGFTRDKTQLRQQKQRLVRSNTRNVYISDKDHLALSEVSQIEEVAQTIEQRRVTLGKTSGFEKSYAEVVRQYFGGMTRHLANLRHYLKPGAQLAYVVGDQASYLQVMIRTGDLLAEIAEYLGYRYIGKDLFRTRLSTKTKEHLREEVLVLRWQGD